MPKADESKNTNEQNGEEDKSGAGRKNPADKNSKDAPDRDSSATKGGGAAGTRPPSDS